MIYKLGLTIVTVYDGYTDTLFYDGKHCTALHEVRAEHFQTAFDFDIPAELMNKDHDLAHSVLAAMLGQEYSQTLWHIAHGSEYDGWATEERAVLSLQAYCYKEGITIEELARRYQS